MSFSVSFGQEYCFCFGSSRTTGTNLFGVHQLVGHLALSQRYLFKKKTKKSFRNINPKQNPHEAKMSKFATGIIPKYVSFSLF